MKPCSTLCKVRIFKHTLLFNCFGDQKKNRLHFQVQAVSNNLYYICFSNTILNRFGAISYLHFCNSCYILNMSSLYMPRKFLRYVISWATRVLPTPEVYFQHYRKKPCMSVDCKAFSLKTEKLRILISASVKLL